MSGAGAPQLHVDGSGMRVVVVAASWHTTVMEGLLAGSRRALADANVAQVDVVRVPGSFELPVAARAAALSGADAVVALGVVSLRLRVVQLVLALLLIVLALPAVPNYYRSAQVEDWNSATHWLLNRYEQNDGLVCYDNSLEQGCQVSVQYYLQAYPNGAHFTPDAPGAFSWEMFGPARPAGPDEAVDPKALAAYGAKHPRLFFIQGRIRDDAAAARAKAAQQWLDKHYHLISSINTRTVTVRLYSTR